MVNFNKLLLFLPIIFAACSTNPSNHRDSIDKEYEKITASSNLQIKIPHGWKEIKDNHEQLFDIWLVNDQYNASIVFIPIYLSEKLNFAEEEDKLETVANIILAKKRSTSESFRIESNKKIISPFEAISIKYQINGNLQNSLIFGRENVFYECQGYFKNSSHRGEVDLEELIYLQKEIIKETTIK